MSMDATSSPPAALQVDPTTLPDDAAVLKSLVAQLFAELQSRDGRISDLEHRLSLLLRKLYGNKSENRATDRPRAELVLARIGQLYDVERDLKARCADEWRDLARSNGFGTPSPGARCSGRAWTSCSTASARASSNALSSGGSTAWAERHVASANSSTSFGNDTLILSA